MSFIHIEIKVFISRDRIHNFTEGINEKAMKNTNGLDIQKSKLIAPHLFSA